MLLILFLLELVAYGVVLVVRFFLGRWTVVAEMSGVRCSWPVRGREQSTAFAEKVASAIQTGSGLPAGGSGYTRWDSASK